MDVKSGKERQYSVEEDAKLPNNRRLNFSTGFDILPIITKSSK